LVGPKTEEEEEEEEEEEVSALFTGAHKKPSHLQRAMRGPFSGLRDSPM
jgi:hypothetical protein